MSTIDLILKDMREGGKFGRIERNNYTEILTLDDFLREIEAVGRFRSSSFAIDADNAKAYQNIAKWFLGDASAVDGSGRPARLDRGIYVAGRTGSGKSWLFEIFRYLATLHAFYLKVYNELKRIDIKSVRADAIVYDFCRCGELEKYVHEPFLLINDLGAEPSEAVYMGNRFDVIRQVIEARADRNGQMTFFTSNLPLDTAKDGVIAQRYGDRVASRLSNMCNYYVLGGGDRRKK